MAKRRIRRRRKRKGPKGQTCKRYKRVRTKKGMARRCADFS